jgi:hypothetical protein
MLWAGQEFVWKVAPFGGPAFVCRVHSLAHNGQDLAHFGQDQPKSLRRRVGSAFSVESSVEMDCAVDL